ncbi:MAG: hypothetical protein A2499_15025 [Stygiobacter sp. RIFOXYC12_FULL_38_8]|nr:MAG: hypothetical protein A2X62_00900 [Stygiobacter sp. GWC2_38_9]OGV07883.1 MAG: hypothetical protein A2299_06945 [Stygiobacter sp. RIFOXYB2_FULL_37_11]OGV10909.1 MAG: hypothetical protein A2237_06600 [Stygiobacter sp. RIFOXYA2_FULL_38_8]OGV12887.1 MAG: hypothetical protein A2440_16780 [Stygiobacter sp. RIFOXYC2_FULL_38_25]OGV24480.1 MAG: hypothetical protein A2499_15025 [Stygiobacter sp. RIFOXYC12_FULL_38_8]OGV81856.1 MAG: hypothetical protein A2X65_13465 [Stygiobacter sp. GWF2_38_21]OGV
MENYTKNVDKFLFSTKGAIKFYLRKATIEDAKPIFDLSNENLVRENSINQKKIMWENHLKWLPNKLCDNNCFYLLAFTPENLFIGQIRFDVSEKETTIGISITKEFRGKGLSADILIHSAGLFFKNYPQVKNIVAKINKDNEASLNTFIKAGYIYSHKESINNNEFLVFKLVRNNEN